MWLRDNKTMTKLFRINLTTYSKISQIGTTNYGVNILWYEPWFWSISYFYILCFCILIDIHILLISTITMLKLQLSLTFFEHLHQKIRNLLMNFSIWLCVWMECDHVGLCSMVFEWKSFSFYSKLVGNRNCGLTLKFSHYLVNPDLVFHH